MTGGFGFGAAGSGAADAEGAERSETPVYLGIDVGGTGSRATIGGADTEILRGPKAEITEAGSTAPAVILGLLEEAADHWNQRFAGVRGVGIGATGVASLVADPQELAATIGNRLGVPCALAIDAITAHLGALRGEGGAVTVLGTGAISVAHPGPNTQGVFPPRWTRVDGWGHLLGDRGGGAWLGMSGLSQALRTHDGVHCSGAGLLEAGRARFGDPKDWPQRFYPRDDRAGALAEFASDVLRLADEGDLAALALCIEAGQEAARSVLAALGDDCPARVAVTGGLAQPGGIVVSSFAAHIAAHRPDVTVIDSHGGPLDGAVILAELAAERRVSEQAGVLWV